MTDEFPDDPDFIDPMLSQALTQPAEDDAPAGSSDDVQDGDD